jgi:hypothetical protein
MKGTDTLKKYSVVEPKLFVSAPAPALAPEPAPIPATALELPSITDFILKSIFFMFFMKESDLIHMLDPIQYEF